MTTRTIASHVVMAEDGLPLDSKGRPEGPLAAARGVFLGIALGTALWVGAALLVHALL